MCTDGENAVFLWFYANSNNVDAATEKSVKEKTQELDDWKKKKRKHLLRATEEFEELLKSCH